MPLLFRHIDEVEKDFALNGWDLRDLFRERGGASRMTLRRAVLLLDALDRTSSHFWAVVTETERLSTESILLSDIWLSVSGSKESHPIRRQKEIAKKQADLEKRKQQILAKARLRKRKYNQ